MATNTQGGGLVPHSSNQLSDSKLLNKAPVPHTVEVFGCLGKIQIYLSKFPGPVIVQFFYNGVSML